MKKIKNDGVTRKNKHSYFAIWGLSLVMVLGFACLAACAPKQQSEAGAGGGNTAESTTMGDAAFTFGMTSDCTGCHTTEAGTMTDAGCPQAIAHKDQSCIGCHTDTKVLTTTHAGLTYADKPDKKSTTDTVDPAMCISCHGDMEAMAAVTVDSQTLIDSNKRVVNPHERPAGETHDENPATCISCHNNHSSNLSKDAMRYCASCHHRGVFTCGNCHEIRKR